MIPKRETYYFNQDNITSKLNFIEQDLKAGKINEIGVWCSLAYGLC